MRNRNTLPLLSRAVPSRSNSPTPSSSFDVYTATPQSNPNPTVPIPAIRLVQATPSPDSTADVNPDVSILAPKEHPSPRKKLVPKKSKLALLTSRASAHSTREKDLSDVMRRVGEGGSGWGMDQDGTCNVTVNGGTARRAKARNSKSRSSRSTIDIYVDPADDPDIGEIVVVKKKKSRAALEGIRWALGEVTNAEGGSAPPPKEDTERVKIKVEEKEKWWSIGRGRRDSKEKEKDTAKVKLRAKAPSASAVPSSSAQAAPRPRNHSLDSGLMLCVPGAANVSPSATLTHPRPPAPFLTVSGAPSSPYGVPPEDCFSAHPSTQSHFATQSQVHLHAQSQAQLQAQQRPRFGSTPGFLQPPDSGYSSAGFNVNLNVPEAEFERGTGGGSLAVRALRSVKSLARIGGWAQLKNTPAPVPGLDTNAMSAPASEGVGVGKEKEKKEDKKKKEKEKEKKKKVLGLDLNNGKRVKSSSSSWEVGALSSPGEDTTHSHANVQAQRYGTMAALGHGFPPQPPSHAQQSQHQDRRDSAGTLLSVGTATSGSSYRTTSTSSSSGLSAPGPSAGNRLSVSSSSGGSRPGSTYTASGEDTGGFAGVDGTRKGKGSVRWGGVVVGGEVREEQKREKEGKESKKESKERRDKEKREKKEKKEKRASMRSLEGRKRTPVSSVFPGLSLGLRHSSGEREAEAKEQRGPEHDAQAQIQIYAHEEHLEDEDGEGDEDQEEACVRIAVHASIPQFQVRGREVSRQFLPQTQANDGPQPSAAQQHQARDTATSSQDWPATEDAPQLSPVPAARPRPRPVSEQLLGNGNNRQRPRGIVGSVTFGGDEGDALALSVLEAANSDLASLINRLDLEATPDSKASRPVSFAPTDPTTSTRFTLEPESPSATRGGVDDSPLKKLASARGRVSITSLRPYAYAGSRGKADNSATATLRASNANANTITVGRAAVPPVPLLIGQPIMPWSSLVSKDHNLSTKPSFPTLRQGRFGADSNLGMGSPLMEMEEDSVPALQPLRPPKYQRPPTAAATATAPRIRSSSSELRARAAPFMRTPSVSSTFGSSLVALANKPTHTPSPHDDSGAPSSHTFGGARPGRYTLPSLHGGSSSPRSVMTAGADTPTPSPRPQRGPGEGHARKRSTLVPFVKRVVESIEARSAQEQEERDAGVKRRSGTSAASTSPLASPTSATSAPSEGMDADARRELGFKGTMGVSDDEEQQLKEEEEDSDIPDELQVILSHSDDTRTSKIGSFPVDALEDTLSFVPPADKAGSTSVISSKTSKLPPSPGLPPAAPLPTPSSTPSVIGGPSLEPSPPAPSFLAFFEHSPSPSLVPPATMLAPILTVQPVSEDGDNEADIDEPNTGSSGSGSDDDTKQSFDFTGELQRLNESGGAHRRSFVEQLENAFKTPSKLGAEALGFEIGGFLGVGAAKESAVDAALEDKHADISMMVESLNESFNLLKPQASVTSKPSYGRLDTAFKFGGKPQPEADNNKSDNSMARELPGVAALSTSPSPEPVLSALPRRHSRASSASMVEEDSSVLRSIFAHAAQNMELPGHRAKPSLSLESDTSSKRRVRQSHIPAHARSSSDTSFSGMSSFGAVRTKFEFGPERPTFFSQSFQLSTSHARQESLFSIASVSSYGEVINNGSQDPFSYGQDAANRDGLPSIDETMSTFEEDRHRKRFSTDSDMSSFYFRAPSQPHITQQRKEHGRNQSVVSTTSMNGPPISLYNRSFGHKRSDSTGSANSIANAYGVHGASGGRAAWIRHQQDRSIDSVMSDFSAVRLGRPGIGDKMFESAADHGPLTSISASPPESVAGDLAQKSSYDSILDDDRRSTIDSIFDNTGQRSSVSSDSVFGYDTNEPVRGNLFPPTHFRPLSIISIGNPETPREDDTMISMLGGGHVRRRSIGSSFEASPCVRVEKREKRKHSDFVHQIGPYGYEAGSPNNARLIHRESVASSTSSKSKFGESRMSLAQRGLLHRDSLEDSCLSAEGEEDLTTHSIRAPIFTRPTPSSRSRSRPLVTISQPPDTTPPLSSSEGSQSGGSQSSIDIARLKVLLQTASAGSRSSSSRARARGNGHRRRASQVSRASSAIGTIQEENPGLSNSPSPGHRSNRDSFESVSSFPPSPCEPASSVEPSVDVVEWDDERMVVGLRRYYALRSEADETISHSRMVWPDTAFSIHALQTFTPPDHPTGMQTLLEHSQKSYIPLPSDLRPRRVRSRTSSINRPSPYPRTVHRSCSPSGSSTKSHRSSVDKSASMSISSSFDRSRALQPITHSNNLTSPAPALAALTPFSPLGLDLSQSEENINISMHAHAPQSVIKPTVRPRVGSAARRNALGWTKRKTPKTKTMEGKFANANKENEAQGLLTSPTESLRIVRPRPRGRIAPTPTPRSTSMLV